VVCFISNYSWLDGLSFTGMRERYLETFDAIRIDCLNGDKYKTGKVAPDGSPNAGELGDGLSAEPFFQPGKVRFDSSPSIRARLFHDVLDDASEFIGVEGTRLGPADQHCERIDVLPSIVQPETHALNQCGSRTGERIEHPLYASIHIPHDAHEHCRHRGNHHRRILSQSVSLTPCSATAKRPVVVVRGRQAFEFADNFIIFVVG